jgi:chemotaxis protein MotA
MDFATIGGITAGLGLIMVYLIVGPGLSTFIDIPGVLICVGGTMTSTMVHFPLSRFVGMFSVVKKTFLYKLPSPTDEISRMVKLARVARSEGLLALENTLDEVKDPFVQKAIQLVVDGTDPAVLNDVLTTEVEQLRQRHMVGKSVLDHMGAMFPSFGMIATLIGLVGMMANMKDATAIGEGMATALVATFYGSLLANLVCIPLAGKLELRSKQETLSKQLVLEGIAAIQAGFNPRLVEEKLKSFLEPKLRANLRLEKAKKAA